VREGRTGQAPATTAQPPGFRPMGISEFRYYRADGE
jgi:hypothetical protein